MAKPAPQQLGAIEEIVVRGNLSVVLAFREPSETGIGYRLLRADVDEGFRRSALETAMTAMRRLHDFDIVPYESSRLLGSQELFHRTVDQAGLDALVQRLRQPALLESANYRDFDDKLGFYAFVFQQPNAWVALVRQAYQVHVSGIHKLIAVFRQQRLTRPSEDQRVLRFDDRFDLLLNQTNVYLLREEAFDNLFVDRSQWQAKVPGHVDLLIEQGLAIINAAEFVTACQSDLNMMRKLQRICESGYLEQITAEKLGRLVTEYKLSQTVLVGGKLNFDPKYRWQILKMLDDDYLSSRLTDRRYEVNSKV